MATGLAAAHAKGGLHRDVKPGNIFLAEGGAVKLLDFGLARGIGDAALTQIGIVAGTPAYVAPEQVAGRTVDQRGDLYGLGCVLYRYRLTAGRTPFGRIGPRAASPGAGSDLPESPTLANPEVPIALSELIQQLLAKDPSERPSSAAQVARRLLESDGRGHADSKGPTSLGNRQRASFRLRIALLTGGPALATFAENDAWHRFNRYNRYRRARVQSPFSSELVFRRAGCVNRACPDLWGPGESNRPRPPDPRSAPRFTCQWHWAG